MGRRWGVNMQHNERIQNKIKHVAEQIDILERSKKAKPQVGGPTFNEVDGQLQFQRWRLRLLQRCLAASQHRVEGWLSAALSSLTAEECACIAGDARNLRSQAYMAVVAIELYQVALGRHSGQRGRS